MKLFRRTSPALSSALPPARRRAFTLVEILIATTILGLTVLGMLKVLVQALSIYYYEVGKIQVNHDIRKFTADMTETATYANYFKVFPAYSSISRNVDVLVNALDPDQGYTTAITDNTIAAGGSGDCVVLVYKDPADDTKIAQLVCYFRAPDATSGVGPVRKATWPITPSSSLPLFQLIPEIPDPTKFPVVVELASGLSNGKLFYNFGTAIIINGAIQHRGGMINTADATATNTYNFTISPRG